jgi:hypothetical protein
MLIQFWNFSVKNLFISLKINEIKILKKINFEEKNTTYIKLMTQLFPSIFVIYLEIKKIFQIKHLRTFI